MKIAKIKDLQKVKSIFAPYLKVYFPHIRADYIKRKVLSNEVVIQDGVVIIFHVNKRRNKIGSVISKKNDVHINQIASSSLGSGAASKVISRFFEAMNTSVYLSVRESNIRARKFYKKNGMQEVGFISWQKGKIPGIVYCYPKVNSFGLSDFMNKLGK